MPPLLPADAPNLFCQQGSLVPVRFYSPKSFELGGARLPRKGKTCIRPLSASNRTHRFREAVQGDKAGSEFIYPWRGLHGTDLREYIRRVDDLSMGYQCRTDQGQEATGGVWEDTVISESLRTPPLYVCRDGDVNDHCFAIRRDREHGTMRSIP